MESKQNDLIAALKSTTGGIHPTVTIGEGEPTGARGPTSARGPAQRTPPTAESRKPATGGEDVGFDLKTATKEGAPPRPRASGGEHAFGTLTVI